MIGKNGIFSFINASNRARWDANYYKRDKILNIIDF